MTPDAPNTLLGLAAVSGVLHTVMGPDHYVPFIAMARAGGWSLTRTLLLTTVCGIGHVLGSVALGIVGLGLGVWVGRLETAEAARGDIAGWLLLSFGLAYLVWGIHRGWRERPHHHWHNHEDGTVHCHEHGHSGPHAHAHESTRPGVTPWVLFVIFVFGPCEILIPQLMYPAAKNNWWLVTAVVVVFGITTLGTMLAVVCLGYAGARRLAFPGLQRYAHAGAGLALTLCGVAIKIGW